MGIVHDLASFFLQQTCGGNVIQPSKKKDSTDFGVSQIYPQLWHFCVVWKNDDKPWDAMGYVHTNP